MLIAQVLYACFSHFNDKIQHIRILSVFLSYTLSCHVHMAVFRRALCCVVLKSTKCQIDSRLVQLLCPVVCFITSSQLACCYFSQLLLSAFI